MVVPIRLSLAQLPSSLHLVEDDCLPVWTSLALLLADLRSQELSVDARVRIFGGSSGTALSSARQLVESTIHLSYLGL